MSKTKTKKKSDTNDETSNATTKTATKPAKPTKSRKPKEKENKINNKNNNNNSANTNRESALPWEIEAVGKFLLDLYLNGILTPRKNFEIPKQLIREKFDAYLKLPVNKSLLEKFTKDTGTFVFGSILYRTHFLINTPRGCDYYRIKGSTLYQYFNQQVQTYDSRCLLHGSHLDRDQNGVDGKASGDNVKFMDSQDDPLLYEGHEVDDNAPCHMLLYQGSLIQAREGDFQLSSMGCDVCQLNFETPDEYEKHVDYHNDETDFEFLRRTERHSGSILRLSVQFCKNSHYLCFTLRTSLKNIVIDKILLVLSRSLFDVHKARGSYEVPDTDTVRFFVDSHLFVQFVEQPVLIRFHSKADDTLHYIEEHHFMRIEEIANMPIGLNPCRLPHTKLFKPKIVLPQYLPPEEIRHASTSDFGYSALFKISNEFNDYITNGQCYSIYNIGESMRMILQVEDMDIILKYKSLIQRYAKIKKFNNEYIVKTTSSRRTFIENVVSSYDEILVIEEKDQQVPEPGAADTEDKDDGPSLKILFGNNEDLRSGKHKGKLYFGMIERVSARGRVTFVCDRKIPEERLYKIIFRPARQTIRYQYRAVELLNAMPMDLKLKFLFPVCESTPTPKRGHQPLNLINKDIGSNPEQYQAVQNIFYGPLKNAPYIIFGPPGTGKTTTVTEAILQLYYHKPNSRILVTAGSNSACDEVALRLVRQLASGSDARAVARIYSRANERRIDNIDELLLEYSNMYTAQFYPHIDVLHEYRIVVCTLTVVGKLATGGFGKNGTYFSHIFVDEVAACTEPEVLVGIMGMLSKSSSLIISGDHKQLGPTLQSKRAAELGLGVSLMMRLMDRNCYRVDEDGNYDRDVQTRLKRNYRSHPEIVNLYNGMYYNNELMALASTDVQYYCENWHRSPNTQYPIIFHSVFGKSELEPTSPSMYNPIEISVVMDYVKDLMYFGISGKKVSQQDIGIISPYKKQYQRIQDELNLRNWYQIETGSVETFQGREKTIIIVSFVRSFTRSLGFLESPQRLNVALSRPKSLLILIGNPKTLSQNGDMKHIIQQCQRHETMVGATLINERSVSNAISGSLDELSVRSSSESTKSSVHGEQLPLHRQWYQQSRFTPETDSTPSKDHLDILFDKLPKLSKISPNGTDKQQQQQQQQKHNDKALNKKTTTTPTTTSRSEQLRARTISLSSATATTSTPTGVSHTVQNSPYNSLFAKSLTPPNTKQVKEFPTLSKLGNLKQQHQQQSKNLTKKSNTTTKRAPAPAPSSSGTITSNNQPKQCHSNVNLRTNGASSTASTLLQTRSKTTIPTAATAAAPKKSASASNLGGSSSTTATLYPTIKSLRPQPAPRTYTTATTTPTAPSAPVRNGHLPTVPATFYSNGSTNPLGAAATQPPRTAEPVYSSGYSGGPRQATADYYQNIPIYMAQPTMRPPERAKSKSKCVIS